MSNRSGPHLAVATARAVPALGGIETHIHEVTKRLTHQFESIAIYTTDRAGDLPVVEEVDGVSINRFRAYPRERDYYFSPALIRALLTSKYELLHVQGIHTLVPPVAMLVSLLRRKPYVITLHTGGSSLRHRTALREMQWRLLAPLLRRAETVIAVSEFERDTFARIMGVDPGTIVVIRNGGLEKGTEPDPSGLPAVGAGPDECFTVVSVGRLERYKGHQRIIRALPLLAQKRPSVKLVILGAGEYEPALRELAEAEGVADRVEIRFVPPADRGEMRRIVSEADVMVLLSDYEAHPVAVMEALALGTPAVVSLNSGMQELVDRDWALGVAEDADPATVAAAVMAQATDPVLPASEELPTWDECAVAVGGVLLRLPVAPAKAAPYVARKQSA